jgi:perosamine synthetase
MRWPPVDEALIEAVAGYLRGGGSLSIAGREGVVTELEDALAAAHGCRYGLAMASGTAALAASFFACDFSPGDQVVVPAYSYHATASPLLQHPVEIVFCDVEGDTGNLSSAALTELVGPRTAAIVTNHQWGHPVDVNGIRSVLSTARQSIKWIEDCSHAHFAEHTAGRVGSFGDVSVFSLQANKLVPAGEGGVLLTSDPDIHDRATIFAYSLTRTESELIQQKYRSLGRTGIGLKHRIHPLGAVIALHVLRSRAETWVRERAVLHEELAGELALIPGVEPPATRPYVRSRGAYYGFKPRFDPGAFPAYISREDFVARAAALGAPAKIPGSGPLYRLPLFCNSPIDLPATVASVPSEGLSGTEIYCGRVIGLPTLSQTEQRPAISLIAEAFRQASSDLRAG